MENSEEIKKLIKLARLPDTYSETVEQMKTDMPPIHRWIIELGLRPGNIRIPFPDLFKSFLLYCEGHGIVYTNGQSIFGKMISKVFPHVAPANKKQYFINKTMDELKTYEKKKDK